VRRANASTRGSRTTSSSRGTLARRTAAGARSAACEKTPRTPPPRAEKTLHHDQKGQTEATRAHGSPNGELPFRGAEPGEEKLGYVAAGDEEHEPDRRHQEPKSGPSPLHDVAMKGNGAHLEVRRLVLGVLLLELGLESLHLLLGFLEPDTRSHAAEAGEARIVPRRSRPDVELDRRPDLRVSKSKRLWRQEEPERLGRTPTIP
jgi:hypothetical protein